MDYINESYRDRKTSWHVWDCSIIERKTDILESAVTNCQLKWTIGGWFQTGEQMLLFISEVLEPALEKLLFQYRGSQDIIFENWS